MSAGARKRWGLRSRTARRAAACLVSAVALTAGDATAQAPRWELEASGSRIEYDTVPALDAPSLAGLLEWQRPTLFGRISTSVTGFEGAGWSWQGRGDLAGWLSPFGTSSRLRLELGATGAGSRHSHGFHSLVGRTEARLHLRGTSAGAWAGAGVAAARNSFDSTTATGLLPSAGAWLQRGPLRVTLGVLATRIFGETHPEVNLAVSASRGLLDLTVYGGLRDSPYEGVSAERWAGASAAIWFHRSAAIVVSGGGYASEVMQGLPGGEFLSIGIRLTPRRVRPVPPSVLAPMVYSAEAARAGSIAFELPGASTVEIAGDWNGWTPQPLSRDGSGRWVVPSGLAPGVYRFNLRVDGERWVVPDGVPAIDDGYGDRVGLLIISGTE